MKLTSKARAVETRLLALFFAGSVLLATAFSQTALRTNVASARPAQSSATPVRSPYLPSRFPKRARNFYELVWGVDSLTARYAESGEVIRFSYRVLDPDKAKTLNDKKFQPYLVDEAAHVKLVIPSLEKVGQLRQASTPEAGKAYWMVFSNKGRFVKPGDRVDVVIGNFHANGLVVE